MPEQQSPFDRYGFLQPESAIGRHVLDLVNETSKDISDQNKRVSHFEVIVRVHTEPLFATLYGKPMTIKAEVVVD